MRRRQSGFDEEVVGAAIFVDGACGKADGASESEAEGLGDVEAVRTWFRPPCRR